MNTPSLVVAILLLAVSPAAHADLVGAVCRGPSSGPIRAVEHDGACTGFEIRSATGTRRVDFGRRASGDLLASADGRTVVMLDSYLHARVTARGRIETIDFRPVVNPPVIAIYRDGKLVASHRIRALVPAGERVQESISHIRWVGKLPASVGGERFTLRTLSGRDITFHAATGAIVEATRPAR